MRREGVKEFRSKSPEEALSSLMRQCARAERSSGDAFRLMSRWGVAVEHRTAIVERLIADKFIDDRRYAEAYMREKLNLSGWGSRKISASLRVKGIAEEIISELFEDVDHEAMRERLQSKLESKSARVKAKDQYDKKSKLIRYGLSLGYDYGVVRDVVSQIITIEDED